MNYERMEAQLILHEGLRLRPYKDSKDIWTCLVGYNFEHRGWEFVERTIGRKVKHLSLDALVFTHEEAVTVLRADILRVEQVVLKLLPEYARACDARQRVVVDMAFNMAYGALAFKRAIAAFKKGNWSEVVRQMYDSKWSREDVGDGEGGRFDRSDRLALMMLTGQDYTR